MGSPRLAVRLREASGHLRGCSAFHGMPLSRSGDIAIPAVFCSPLRLASAAPLRRAARAPSAGNRRFTWVRAMPCWRACGPARWGRRSSYGNGFAIFSRYITEPRDLASESSRPTPDIRLSALIRAIVSPWKGVSEPPSLATVKYRKFSSIPLPCPKKQGDAGGHRRAIAGLHGAVPPGCAAIHIADPGNRWSTPLPRALRRAGTPVPAVEPGERRDRAASTCLTCEKAESKN